MKTMSLQIETINKGIEIIKKDPKRNSRLKSTITNENSQLRINSRSQQTEERISKLYVTSMGDLSNLRKRKIERYVKINQQYSETFGKPSGMPVCA